MLEKATSTGSGRRSRPVPRRSKKPANKKTNTRAPRFKDTGHQGNYCNAAVDYALEATADKKGIKHGKWLRLAAKRFLADLKRAKGKRPPFTFDPWHGNDACDFIERLHHVKGVWKKPTIVLHPSHVFFVVQLFGFRNKDGGRRFTSALFNVARKNAKSTLAAGILLYCECEENEPGAELLVAATTFDQTDPIFKTAKAMVGLNAPMREHYGLEVFSKSIVHTGTNGSIKPIHSKASTQDGLNPSHTAVDEVHAHKTHDLINVLRSSAGARGNPLWLYTTTEGYLNPGPWGEIRRFARQVLEGVFGAETDYYLAVIFAVDEKDEEFDERVWRKANPLMDVNPILLSEIRKDATEAKAMPGKLAEFRIKRLNRQAAAAEAWIDIPRWKRCSGPVDLKKLEGAPCWAGLDLASTTDLTSWRLLWFLDGRWYTWGRRWVPDDAVAQRTERGTVPYAAWVEEGLITQTPGNVVDDKIIEAQIIEDWERFQPSIVAYDPWNAAGMASRLTDAGVTMAQFIQGGKSYHPAFKALEIAYRSGNLSHGGDKVLLWCASNLVPRYDANMNMAPDKKRSAEKIDDMAALLMAFGVAEGEQPEEPDFQMFFV